MPPYASRAAFSFRFAQLPLDHLFPPRLLQSYQVSPSDAAALDGCGAGSAVSTKITMDCGACATISVPPSGAATLRVVSVHSAHGSASNGSFTPDDSKHAHCPQLSAQLPAIMQLVRNDVDAAWLHYNSLGSPSTSESNFRRACRDYLASPRGGLETDQGLFLQWAAEHPESFQKYIVQFKLAGYELVVKLSDGSSVSLGRNSSFTLASTPENILRFSNIKVVFTDHAHGLEDSTTACLAQISGYDDSDNSTRVIAVAVVSSKESAIVAVILHFLRQAAMAANGGSELAVHHHIHDCLPSDFKAVRLALPSVCTHKFCTWHLVDDLPKLLRAALVKDKAAHLFPDLMTAYRSLMDVLDSDLLAVGLFGFWQRFKDLENVTALFSRAPYNDLPAVMSALSFFPRAGWASTDAGCEGPFASLRRLQESVFHKRVTFGNSSGALWLSMRWMINNGSAHDLTASARASRLSAQSAAAASVSSLSAALGAGALAVGDAKPPRAYQLSVAQLRVLASQSSASAPLDVFSPGAVAAPISAAEIAAHSPLSKAQGFLASFALDTCAAAATPGAYNRLRAYLPAGPNFTLSVVYGAFAAGFSPMLATSAINVTTALSAAAPPPPPHPARAGAGAAVPARAALQLYSQSQPRRALPPLAGPPLPPAPLAAAAPLAPAHDGRIQLDVDGVPLFWHLANVGRPAARTSLLRTCRIDGEPEIPGDVIANLQRLGAAAHVRARCDGAVIFGYRSTIVIGPGPGKPRALVPSHVSKQLSLAGLIVSASGAAAAAGPRKRKRGRNEDVA